MLGCHDSLKLCGYMSGHFWVLVLCSVCTKKRAAQSHFKSAVVIVFVPGVAIVGMACCCFDPRIGLKQPVGIQVVGE